MCDSKIYEDDEECPECGLEREFMDVDDDFEDKSDEELDELIKGLEDEIDIDDDEILDDEFLSIDEELEPDDESLDDAIEELEEELNLEVNGSPVETTDQIEELPETDESDDVSGMIEEEPEKEESEEKSIEDEVIFQCPACESEVDQDAARCPNCGVLFEEDTERDEIDEGLEKEVRRSIDEASEKLTDFSGRPIPTDHFESLIDKAEELADSHRYSDAIEKAQEAIEFGEDMEVFSEELEQVRDRIENLKKEGVDASHILTKEEEAKRLMSEGVVEEAISTLKEAMTLVEKIQKGDERGLKERINRAIKDLNDILEIGKQIGVPFKQIRGTISTALELSREGDVQDALSELELARERSSEILNEKLDEKLEEARIETESILSEKKREELIKNINRAEKAKENNDFKRAHELILECKENTEKSGLRVDGVRVNEIIRIKNLAESIGIECVKAENLINKAKEAHSDTDKRLSKRYLKKAKKNLMRHVPKELQKTMRNGMRTLEKAKKRGEDISKPVGHLKKANLLIKKKEFVKALEQVKEFIEHLEDTEVEQEVVSTTVKRSPDGGETEASDMKKKTKKRDPSIDSKKTMRSSQTISYKRETSQEDPKSPRKDTSKRLEPDDFYSGSTNLLKMKDHSAAYELFKVLVERTGLGVCVTREYPDKVRKKYDLEKYFSEKRSSEEISMIWLSTVSSEEAVKPKELEKLSLKLESFISSEKGVILLNGLEFLVSNNPFNTILHFIQSLKDQVAVGGAILMITVSPDSFSKSQMDQLEREVDEVFT